MTSSLSALPLDIDTIRRDFPILARSERGHPLVYLDSAATSQKPDSVLAAVDTYYRHSNANVHRGVYALAEEATQAYEGARDTIARFIGAEREETVFVRNASEAINLVAYAWGHQNTGEGDLIVLTELEHHSNLVPWQLLARQTGVELAFISLEADGSLNLESLKRYLETGRVRLVACALVSNVLGTIAPAPEIVKMAHDADALVLLDGAQAVPHMSVNVRELDVDFLAFTGHKMLGPMGIGVLFGKQEILQHMPPFLGGGEMIRRVSLQESTWNDLPWKFEAGTPDVGAAVGLAAAVRYLEDVGMSAVETHDRLLASYALERLADLRKVTIYGPRERGALVAFNVDGVHPHDLASLLDEQGIAIRAGHHCAQPLHDRLAVPATSRASFYLYNDERDIDALVDGIEQARMVFLA